MAYIVVAYVAVAPQMKERTAYVVVAYIVVAYVAVVPQMKERTAKLGIYKTFEKGEVRMAMHMSTQMSIHMSIHMTIHMSMHMSMHMSVHTQVLFKEGSHISGSSKMVFEVTWWHGGMVTW